MKPLFLLFCIICCCVEVCATGLSFGLQSAWSTKERAVVYTGGYMIRSPWRDLEYYEGGALVLPASRTGITLNEPAQYSKQYQNSAYGFYGGYFFYFMPIFRPGILIGTAVRDDVIYNSMDGDTYYRYSYSDFRMDYYVALSVQMGLFSLTISNYGFGGGLNYMW